MQAGMHANGFTCKQVYVLTCKPVNPQTGKLLNLQAGIQVCRFTSKQVDLTIYAMVYSVVIWFYTICLKIQTVGHLPSLVR
jgi:hypothetical protein